MDPLPVIDEVLRTPEERFAAVPDFPYRPRYLEVGGLRIAYVDERPAGAAPALIEAPIALDQPLDVPQRADDAYVYWSNRSARERTGEALEYPRFPRVEAAAMAP